MRKRGQIQQTVIHIILIAIILTLLIISLGNTNKIDTKRQLLEKQTAVLIEASQEGTILELNRENTQGLTLIENIRIEDYKIYFDIDSKTSKDGAPFFSKYPVTIETQATKFRIIIG
jgi:hypothetical protein